MVESGSNNTNQAGIRIDEGKVVCTGDWLLSNLHPVETFLSHQHWAGHKSLEFDMHAVTAIDTAAAWLLHRTQLKLEEAGIAARITGLSGEAQELYDMVCRTLAAPAELSRQKSPMFLEAIGRNVSGSAHKSLNYIGFTGEMFSIFLATLVSPSRFRWRMVFHEMGEAGYKALGIVGLLSFLLGVVIAYQGGVQLKLYGANIFIADLVGLSMLRELAPLITAIIVAGRTGSAYTAQIGTMQVTEEVDALRTMGVTPIEMLVLPKVIALVIVLPLLSVYADIAGVLGGMVMANTQLGIIFSTFIDRLSVAVSVDSYLVGIGKAPVFAMIIATVGCYQGFQVQGSAESVGRRTTISVVESIFAVIVVDALFSVAFSYLGI